MALRLSICHQSSANEGAASAGAHVISTICDSTHEALVRANTLVLFFWEGGGKLGRKGRYLYMCVPCFFQGHCCSTRPCIDGGVGGEEKL